MPVIRVEMFKGRTVEQKRNMIKEVTQAFVRTCGGSAAAVHVVITDVDKSDWGSGGELCADKFPD